MADCQKHSFLQESHSFEEALSVSQIAVGAQAHPAPVAIPLLVECLPDKPIIVRPDDLTKGIMEVPCLSFI